MISSGIVRVSHQFFEEAMHPDLDELRRRDEFLNRIASEMNIRYEGDDIVADIPDIELEALTNM